MTVGIYKHSASDDLVTTALTSAIAVYGQIVYLGQSIWHTMTYKLINCLKAFVDEINLEPGLITTDRLK